MSKPQEPMMTQIIMRKRWLVGHTLRKTVESLNKYLSGTHNDNKEGDAPNRYKDSPLEVLKDVGLS
uniref:Uncharacterized protein n=1 Tax=Arion vulgaris TaxID=1028688 RepID=A0A0B6XXH3_9EUPU